MMTIIGLCLAAALGLFFYQVLHFSLMASLLLVAATLGGFGVLVFLIVAGIFIKECLD